jgi:5-methylcytosine-specific restriction endonuclease McrA
MNRIDMTSFRADLARIHGWQCAYCGCVLTESQATVDHITPLSRGGTHEMGNLALCCQGCNTQKHNKTLPEYISWMMRNGQEKFSVGVDREHKLAQYRNGIARLNIAIAWLTMLLQQPKRESR